MTTHSAAQGSGTFGIGSDLTVNRLGFGAMRLTGKGVWGPPDDRDECIRVLRRAVELGVNFIDTADSYGPYVSEKLIREAGKTRAAPAYTNNTAKPGTCSANLPQPKQNWHLANPRPARPRPANPPLHFVILSKAKNPLSATTPRTVFVTMTPQNHHSNAR